MNACQDRDVPIYLIEKGIMDTDCGVKEAALYACCGRSVPSSFLEIGLGYETHTVQEASIAAYKSNNIPLPIIRTIEPPELVYKKCRGGIIVAAHIPEDAQIRGDFRGMYRSNKAVIKDIIGDIHGEKVGISLHDCKTLYYAGQEVEIKDFDFSDFVYKTGFHFFTTLEEAQNNDW